MYHRHEVPPELERLARAQSGVLVRTQILGCGVSDNVLDRLVSAGLFGRIERGLFAYPHGTPPWTGWVWAGVLMGGPHARAGGMTAARLQGLADQQPQTIDILTPAGTRPAARNWVTFREERPGVRSISTRTEPPCTRIEDTVLDLCTAGPAAAIEWITAAIQRRLTSPEALQRALQRRRRIPNRRLITGIIADAADGVHSSLEYHYRHAVEKAHSLPRGQRQQSRGARREFVDVLYADYALVVELDGRLGHVGRLRDRRRDNVHTKTGSPSLRYGWTEVTQESCEVALEVAEVLIGQGWSGSPGHCPRCLR
ncbi:Transcriptional regulator, AbiEi antitoxin, Type IV TA system [Nakamurella panacisegetis]|uniref:Transcriptional regulator, AbiEi antitoxin, Type IV TA system n=1 Tax=Nakamurella panacisegetis TaxID=1090615 RepID=A0A1H0K468_9ACTN|nr:type IV toxin-antitoxin system AbiEi family antitoxin domain-containing protein [Nakamurella panacisegetis]SDO50657.1 Transcriptional regulator, AbiEi antitoxin, Type IV TA system [Nakamurella panacisegetis]